MTAWWAAAISLAALAAIAARAMSAAAATPSPISGTARTRSSVLGISSTFGKRTTTRYLRFANFFRQRNSRRARNADCRVSISATNNVATNLTIARNFRISLQCRMFEQINDKMDLLRRSPSDRRDVLVAMKQRLDAGSDLSRKWPSPARAARAHGRALHDQSQRPHGASRPHFARGVQLPSGDAFCRTLRWPRARRGWRKTKSSMRMVCSCTKSIRRPPHSGDSTCLWCASPAQAVSSSAVPTAMLEVFRWLATSRGTHAISQAAELHLRLMYIQPFSEMNGRIARLWMNLLLQQRGLPPALLAAEDRPVYGEAIARAGIDGGRALERLLASASNARSICVLGRL